MFDSSLVSYWPMFVKVFLVLWALVIAFMAMMGASSFHGKYEVMIVSPYTPTGKNAEVIDTIVLARHNRIAVIRNLNQLPWESVNDLKVPLWTHTLDSSVLIDSGRYVMNADNTARLFSGTDEKQEQREREQNFHKQLQITDGNRTPTIEINALSPDVYDSFDWFRNRWEKWRPDTDQKDCQTRGQLGTTQADNTRSTAPNFDGTKDYNDNFHNEFCENLLFVPKCQCPKKDPDYDENVGTKKEFITKWKRWKKADGTEYDETRENGEDHPRHYTTTDKSPFVGGGVALFADQYYHLVVTFVYLVLIGAFLIMERPMLTSIIVMSLMWLLAIMVTGAFHFNQFTLKKGMGPFLQASGEMSTDSTDMRMIYGTTAHMSLISFIFQLLFLLPFCAQLNMVGIFKCRLDASDMPSAKTVAGFF